MILETRKQDMIKTWYCPFYGLPGNILSWRYSFLLLFLVFRGNHWEVFYKSWKENEKYLKTSRCFYKRTTILKMNSFIVIFMDFYHRYGTILWKEEYFLKKLFLWNTSQWLLPEAYSERCQKSKIECFEKQSTAKSR